MKSQCVGEEMKKKDEKKRNKKLVDRWCTGDFKCAEEAAGITFDAQFYYAVCRTFFFRKKN